MVFLVWSGLGRSGQSALTDLYGLSICCYATGESVKIDLHLVSYNGMGGHHTLSFVGDLLLGLPRPSFGTAVGQIEAYAHLDSDGSTLPTLERLRQRFRDRVATMPQAWFRRKTKRIELAYHSRLGSADDLLKGKSRRTGSKDIPLIRRAYSELAAALEVVRKRVRPTDDFDTAGFFELLSNREKMFNAASDREVLKWLRESQEMERQRVAANRPVA